jgi:hypothetical protein
MRDGLTEEWGDHEPFGYKLIATAAWYLAFESRTVMRFPQAMTSGVGGGVSRMIRKVSGVNPLRARRRGLVTINVEKPRPTVCHK